MKDHKHCIYHEISSGREGAILVNKPMVLRANQPSSRLEQKWRHALLQSRSLTSPRPKSKLRPATKCPDNGAVFPKFSIQWLFLTAYEYPYQGLHAYLLYIVEDGPRWAKQNRTLSNRRSSHNCKVYEHAISINCI